MVKLLPYFMCFSIHNKTKPEPAGCDPPVYVGWAIWDFMG